MSPPIESARGGPGDPLTIAYSPCPNDTFVYHAWTAGLLPGVRPPKVTIADIDVTNTLAEHWESRTGLPIPLGAIVGRRDLGVERLAEVTEAIRASVRHAWADPAASQASVIERAQEMAPGVVDQHIALYVNEYTADLGETGYRAVRTLLGSAAEAGDVPAFSLEALEPELAAIHL
jgi:predicted solute-binding protein